LPGETVPAKALAVSSAAREMLVIEVIFMVLSIGFGTAT
jgi:hypothetical protein